VIGLVVGYGTPVMLWESRRFNSGCVEAKERKSSIFRSAIVPIDLVVAASTGVRMVGGTVGHKSPSNISHAQNSTGHSLLLPALLAVGRCVCVCGSTGFVNPQRIHTHSFSLPGCLWMRTASKSTLPLPVAEPGHFCSAICASRNISSSLSSSLVTIYYFCSGYLK